MVCSGYKTETVRLFFLSDVPDGFNTSVYRSVDRIASEFGFQAFVPNIGKLF